MTNRAKFKLHFGNTVIETLNDLRNNFFIDEVIEKYKNGTLANWLELNGYENELSEVKRIHAEDNRSLLIELKKIFHIADVPAKIDDQERSKILERFAKLGGNHPMLREQETDDPW